MDGSRSNADRGPAALAYIQITKPNWGREAAGYPWTIEGQVHNDHYRGVCKCFFRAHTIAGARVIFSFAVTRIWAPLYRKEKRGRNRGPSAATLNLLVDIWAIGPRSWSPLPERKERGMKCKQAINCLGYKRLGCSWFVAMPVIGPQLIAGLRKKKKRDDWIPFSLSM